MARARNIKPGFFLNDELAEVDPLGRILFAGLWTVADRDGRLEDRPKRIKTEILPYDDCDVDGLLQALADKKFIVRYQANGENFIQIINFLKHQNPHKNEKPSEIPEPDLHSTSTVQELCKHDATTGKALDNTTTTMGQVPDGNEKLPDKKSVPKNGNDDEASKIRRLKDSGASTVQVPDLHSTTQEIYETNPADSFNPITESLNTDSFNPDSESDSVSEELEELVQAYRSNVGELDQKSMGQLIDLVDRYSSTWVIEAIRVAGKNKASSIAYVEAVLKNWKRDGFGSKKAALEEKARRLAKHDCPRCGGTGKVKLKDDLTGQVIEYTCDCCKMAM